MPSTFSGFLNLTAQANELIDEGIASGSIPAKIVEELSFSQGTSAGQINKAYYKRESGISSSVTTVYDLIGTLTDKSGATINFDQVVLIIIKNLSTDTADHLEVGPDSSHGFGVLASNQGFWKDASDRSIVPANSFAVWYSYAGVPAAAGSSDELAVITPSGSAANTWDILILGRDT